MNKIYPYKPKPLTFIAATLFFGACTVVLGYVSVTNEKGLVLNRVFEFSAQNASILYGLLALASIVFVLIGIAAIFASYTSSATVVLTDKTIRAPNRALPIRQRTIELAYAEVQSFEVKSMSGQTWIVAVGPDNTKLEIQQQMLPSKAAFDEILRSLTEKLGAV